MESDTALARDANLIRIRDAVLQATPAKAIYLFGSRAKGVARPDSDYDILVVTDDERPVSEICGSIRLNLLERHVPLDILIFMSDEFEWRKNHVNTMPRVAYREGVRLDG